MYLLSLCGLGRVWKMFLSDVRHSLWEIKSSYRWFAEWRRHRGHRHQGQCHILTKFGANITQSGEYDAMASLCRWQEWFFKHALVQRCLNNSEIQCLIFVTGQGGGRRQCDSIVDWRQQKNCTNPLDWCNIHHYLCQAILERVSKFIPDICIATRMRRIHHFAWYLCQIQVT